MSTQITEPSAAAEQQRQGLTAALAVASQMILTSPLPPSSVTVTCNPFAVDAPSVEVNFYGATAEQGVTLLAEALSVTATTQPHTRTDATPYVSAHAEVASVPVRVWALLSGSNATGVAA